MKVGIRADGGFQMGLGHIYKSVWLAEALREKGYDVEFLTTEDPSAEKLIRRNGFSLHALSSECSESEKVDGVNRWLKINRPKIFVVDHWDWPSVCWERLEKQAGSTFVAMDIPPEGFGKFDLAFQGVRNSLQDHEFIQNGCSVYEGPKYLMIPSRFSPFSHAWKPSSRLENILLTFGGTDVAGFSSKVLDRLEKASFDFKLTLAVGPGGDASPIREKFSQESRRVLKNSRLDVTLREDVTCLPELLCQADLAVTTAGLGTLSELALTGTPAIVLAAVDHQIDNAVKFSGRGGIINCAQRTGVVGDEFDAALQSLVDNPERLGELSRQWNGLVDARGIERMVMVIEEKVHGIS